MRINTILGCVGALLFLASPASAQQVSESGSEKPAAVAELRSTYVLGPDDQITIRAVEAEELADKPLRIGTDGYIRLPLVGRVRAAGLTTVQLEAELMAGLSPYIRKPEVSVSITEFRSQPASVLGSVKNPGVHQLQGRKTLVEILSMAGGLTDDAGPVVKITRRRESGPIPLPTAAVSATGEYSTAEVKINSIVQANSPEQNIIVQPHDVISVPRAEMIYVAGEVLRSGGFVLNERESLSVLQALALAGGADKTAAPQNSRILRATPGQPGRTEIRVNIRRVLEGKDEDIVLKANDILFVPTSAPKRAALRAVEAAVQMGTGIVIWRR